MRFVKNGRIVGVIVIAIVILVFFVQSIVIVDTGRKGILIRLGKAISVKDPGMSFKIPIVDFVKMMEVRDQNVQKNYGVSSKDIQTIDVIINVQYSITGDVLSLYDKFGVDYKERLIEPRVSESVNAVVARYTIEEFIEKRSILAKELLQELKNDFDPYGINVSASSIIEHEFSDEFNNSIESKKIAEQNALRAKNDLERVKYEAQAEIEKAQGIAKANIILQESLTDRLIKQKAIDKWDGKMPAYLGGDGAVPFINIK